MIYFTSRQLVSMEKLPNKSNEITPSKCKKERVKTKITCVKQDQIL